MLPKIDDDFDKTRALGAQQATAMAQHADPDALRAGTVAGAYVLEKPLASGGGGTVYEAKHRLLGRRAAVKVLRRELASSPQMVARFLREALAVNLIKHPNIVDIYEFGELPDGRPFYVMELLDGTDLRSMLTTRGRFNATEVVHILTPVCSALDAAHAQGIVHRDLKASNIHIEQRGSEQIVKLLDFGIAKLVHPDAGDVGLTVAGARLGTSYTMAPEQIRGGTIDARTDVYALGVVLYHLLTGQYPFRGEQMTDIERLHLESPPPRPSQSAPVTPAVDAVVLRAMEKQPERRYATAKAFITALRDAVGIARPTQAVPAVAARAMAIFVELRTADTADADSDELLDDVSAVLDAAEQQLREEGWQLPLQTGNALLGVKLLPQAEGDRGAARAGGIALAHALAAQFASRATAHADVHVNVTLHVDGAEVRDSDDVPGGKEITGGGVTSIGAWAPQENVSGVHLTVAVAAVG
ncbi:MAG: serine/threonine-protein kinase [Myxococcales bacterium]